LRSALLPFAVVVIAGCAATPPSPPQPVRYRCDEGRQFAVTYLPGGKFAHIEIARMRFELEAEPADGSGERYGCGVLTLWRDGQGARVELQGEGMYANCRPLE
jgi:membrane-bound inhibitor of C-type lysozyme